MGCKGPEKDKEKEKKENISAWPRFGRIVDFVFVVPPSLPMVSLVHSYVCVAHGPQFGWS